MRILLTLLFLIQTVIGFSCHYSYLTLNGGPTSIGGGLYSTNVTVCIGQKQNFGATNNFTLCMDVPITSASGPNFPTVTNTYNICGGPCGPTQSITATATGSISGNCITYNTTSSTPAGYPLVPDRYDGGAGAAGNSNSFCFTITIVTNGYPGTLALAGRVEADPGVSGNDGSHTPCGGNPYDAAMTLTFPILPIELVSFNAYNKDGINYLNWVTQSEINNDYFTIERTKDGQIFEVVGVINGAGNSSSENTYDLQDKDAPNGLSYYRLKQTDYDGTSEYSGLVAVNIKSPFDELTMKPNPVSGNGILSFKAYGMANALVTVYDVSGRVAFTEQFEVSSGENQLPLNTESLTQGMYFLSLDNGVETTTLKFIKD